MKDPVGVDGHGAVGGPVTSDRGQRVAVGVGVVAQHAGRGDGERGVFGGGVGGVVDRDRGVVVDGDDGESDRGGVGVRATEQQTAQTVDVETPVSSLTSTVNSSGPV